ncbi:MAG: hypothetical protein VR72_18300 [Clostridiaceae bacterium BRH_c20a]|nr:MAG: hypothetical protein VR72_18300 [Clostridiaceae bacterium BRH_c20a]
MEKEVLKVNGMSCTHCKKSIENALKEIGVSGTVNLEAKHVVVEYDKEKISLKKIISEIEDQGYEIV